MLGTSETIGDFSDLFATLDRKAKIYQRKADFHGIQRASFNRFLQPMKGLDTTQQTTADKTPLTGKMSPREITEHALLQQIAPAAALVNGQGVILYIHGRTGMYLEPTPGETGINNILKMAREGLRRELTTSLHKCTQTKEIIRIPGLRVKTNGDFTTVNLTICPVTVSLSEISDSPLFLVILEDTPLMRPTSRDQTLQDHGLSSEYEINIDTLKQELRAKEEYLQTTNEELETSNEELKSSNEEMQSINEELQSTNEELETSKEELQSVNEELSTVNSELQTKLADLSRTNNDMNNLLAGTGIGTIFVDFQLRILRFTPVVTKIINLIQSDIGRPVGHLMSNLVEYDQLTKDVKSVLDTLIPIEIEVQTKMGMYFTMRIQPYRTLDNVIEGAVITFVDITEIKQIQKKLKETESLNALAIIVRDMDDAIIQYDLDGNILAWNRGANKLYGWGDDQTVKKNFYDLISNKNSENSWDTIKHLSNAPVPESVRMQRVKKDKNEIEIWLTATKLINENGQAYAIVTTERKIG